MSDLLRCKNCGSNKLHEENNFNVCDYCGSKYPVVRVIDSVIELQDDIQMLLDKCKKDPRNARKYANLILDIDPQNVMAMQYLRGIV